jgi:endonuclease YncB( thermonuclease family)
VAKWAVGLIAAVLVAGGAGAQQSENPLLVGEFAVKEAIDGDTIVVEGLKKSIRFLCIDTEECEKGPGAYERTQRLMRNFAAYAREHVREKPIGTFNTPMGWRAKEFAEKWFPAGSRVRIEYDSLDRKTGYYGRVLGYVFARVDGKWVNYNVECVRAGMSAYFDKYGRSKRFEAQFIAAEREARIFARGIWSPYAMAYPNYDERLAVWWRRGRSITRFEEKHGGQENAVAVMDEDDWARLPGLEGKEVLLFSTANRVNRRADPPIVELHHKEFARLAVTFKDADVFAAVNEFLEDHEHDFLYFRGVLGPGFEQGTRAYPHRLEIADPKQVFADLPGEAERIRFPRRKVTLTGDRIRWEDAGKHVGRTVTVVGKIVRTNNIGRLTFLNFHRDFRSTLTLVIKKEHYENFPEPAEKTYRDRVIAARGKITVHRGAPQIEITSPEQIEILE